MSTGPHLLLRTLAPLVTSCHHQQLQWNLKSGPTLSSDTDAWTHLKLKNCVIAKFEKDFFCSADSAHDHPAVSFPETEALMLHEKGTRLIDFLSGFGCVYHGQHEKTLNTLLLAHARKTPRSGAGVMFPELICNCLIHNNTIIKKLVNKLNIQKHI